MENSETKIQASQEVQKEAVPPRTAGEFLSQHPELLTEDTLSYLYETMGQLPKERNAKFQVLREVVKKLGIPLNLTRDIYQTRQLIGDIGRTIMHSLIIKEKELSPGDKVNVKRGRDNIVETGTIASISKNFKVMIKKDSNGETRPYNPGGVEKA